MIIFDLDGTLADCNHRRHLVDPKAVYFEHFSKDYFCLGNVKEESLDKPLMDLQNADIKDWKPDWKAFYEACDKDIRIEPTTSLMQWMPRAFNVEIWSGRCESVREKTEAWLAKYIWFDEERLPLRMRPINDFTPDDELKEQWLNESISRGQEVDYVFDDRPKVIRMWRRRGIFVFNCCQHSEEF